MLEEIHLPQEQLDYFKASHLSVLFSSKIARTQATGKDGMRVHRFFEHLKSETELIERKVSNGSYRFTNYKERLILRGPDREPRQISIPTVRDRLVLRALCEVLHAHLPSTHTPPPHTIIREIVQYIRSLKSAYTFVRIDVENFFPSIPHKLLAEKLDKQGLEAIARDMAMKAITNPTGSATEPREKGVPQGLSASGALAAAYMADFDAAQREKGGMYFRYVDDILVICEEDTAKERFAELSHDLAAIGLRSHPLDTSGKSDIRPVKDGIDYLGYHINISAVSVRDSSYSRMFRNLLRVITDYRYRGNQARLIFRLNLKITGCLVDGKRRGWLMFFSQSENLSQMANLDRFVAQQLTRVGYPEKRNSEIKRFVKSYHEIRHHTFTSDYIPNFDTYDLNQKKDTIVALSKYTIEEIGTWSVTSIDEEFSRLISREISALEQDLGQIS